MEIKEVQQDTITKKDIKEKNEINKLLNKHYNLEDNNNLSYEAISDCYERSMMRSRYEKYLENNMRNRYEEFLEYYKNTDYKKWML